MKGINYIKLKQVQWAKRNGIKLTGSQGNRGLPIYTETLDQNLFEPLMAETKAQIQAGDGGEINDTQHKPAKMRALHSSSAIGVNIFQYWDKIKKVQEIAHACGLCRYSNRISNRIVYEKKYSIDNAFQYPPNIDIVIENSDQSQYKVFAIECKFSEAYGSYGHDGIDPKYLSLKHLWRDIPNIYAFAKSISPDDNEFKFLHPAQLIKHILGLKRAYRKSAFRILYLWYDILGEEGFRHRQEVSRFSDIIRKDNIKFSTISYQELISRLAANYRGGNENYLNYITDRYL